ncbi:LOW QUALITY PROTEIN: titin-like [Syngnathoides biaculeatus]|uniref:LOW QUALITY PROTEIN: titin-like n=1 Tax=Syngnathoides biaculeatus TaxID=300417 RepID=UPI002ADE7B13|nr:LOW QUALITY PROTEIN: titin-like [Syngnathoides biaculeatus]
MATLEPAQAIDRLTPPEVDIDATFKQMKPFKRVRTTVSLKWLTPLNDGGSPIVGYIIERKPYTLTGEGRWLKCNYTNVVDNFYTVTALGEGEPYEFRVIAKNANQVFSTPSESTGSVQCKIDFEPPKAQLDSKLLSEVVMVRAGSDLVLDAAVGGRPDPKASWSKGNRELELCDKYHLQYTSNRAMAIIKFCDRDDTGKYILTVRNVSGTKTAEVNVKVLDTPGVCEGSIEISRITEESCTLSWKPPLEDGGDEVSHYLVERRDTNRLNWVFMHAECKDLICNITGLLKNTEYLFRVRGVNKYGAGIPLLSEAMVARNTFTVPTPPGAPEILVSGKDFATIEWLKPESDGGSPLIHYLVERREKKSARWVKVNRSGAHLDTMLKVSGLAEGSIYQFRVTAINKAGESEPSEVSLYVVCRVPTCTPSPPSVPRITDTHADSISLAWSRPVEDGGADVLGYILEMQEVGKEEWTKAHEKTLRTSEHMVTGLCSGKKYCFRVAGININGTGDFSERCTETEPVERIETPDFELHDDLKKTICLRAGGCLRLFVNITGRPAPTIAWSKPGVNLNNRGFIEVTHKSTTLIIDKVHRYDAGKYTIVAENSAGKQEVSLLVKVYDTPGPTGPIKIKELTKEYAIISWEGPTVDGGAPVNNYIVERREASMRAYKTVTSKCSKTSFKIDGLMEGMLYYFRVLPENIYGVGEPCETADVILVCEVPHPPRKLEVVDITKTTVSLSWEKPEHDGGSRLIGYVVEACKFGTEKWMKVASLKLTDFEHTIEKLNEKEQYLLRIKAINSRGASEAKELVTPVTVQEQRLMPAVDFTNIPQKAVNVEAGKTLELDMPIIGRPPPSCFWFFGDNRIKITDRVKIQSTGKFSKLTMSDTTIDDTGNYTLEMKNTVGVTTEVIKVVILSKPDEPKGPIRFDEIDATTVTCSWDSPPRDGGAPISGYVVEQRDAHRPGWVPVCDSVSRPTFKFENLIEGDEYVFRHGGVVRLSLPIKGKPQPTCSWFKDGGTVSTKAMVAHTEDTSELVIKGAERSDSGVYELLLENKVGKKKVQIKVNVIGRPSAPEGPLVFEEIQANSVKVSWKVPTDNGGTEILGYIVERREVTRNAWYTVDSKVTDNQLVVRGLNEGTEYHFKVTAENSFGIGPSLKSEQPLLPKTPLCPPEPSSAPPEIMDVTKNSVALGWYRPKDDGGSTITGYFIEYKEVSTEQWSRHPTKIMSTMFTQSGLTADANYHFRIVAVNDVGESEAGPVSDPVICKDPFDKPSQPGEIDTTNVTNKLITISWQAPECDGGKVVQGYWVEYRKSTESSWKKCNKQRVKELEFTMVGLAEATEYEFRVFAENETGISRPRRTATCIKTKLGVETKPSLRKEIDEVTEKLGQPAVMKCQIIGRPVPEIRWYHAGREIVESRRYEMNSDGRNHSLSIMTDQQEDEGAYTCKATNDAGEAETTGILVLEAAPSFHSDYPLKNTYYAGLGTTLRIHAPYIGRPVPKITWLQEAKTLETSEDISIETTEYYSHLIIKNVQRRIHGGKYRIRLHNHFGRVDAAFKVEIYVCDYSEESSSIVPATAVDVQAPAFKEELRNMSVKYKSNATLVCKITGQPKPVIKWFRRGKEIHADEKKIKIQEFKGGYHQLVIAEVDEEDSTVYQIRATNQGGSICATISLDVEIPATIHLPKNLKDKEAIPALRGEMVNIKIPFGGKPDPVITWQKGQDLIDSNGHYQVIVTRSFTSLVFPHGVEKKDAGFHIVCAKNRFGIDQQTVELDVADVPNPPPRGLKASDISRDSVTLNWVAPANDGGSKVISYIIEKCPTTAERWERVAQSRDSRYTVINLFGGTSYQFRVIAENKFGWTWNSSNVEHHLTSCRNPDR